MFKNDKSNFQAVGPLEIRKIGLKLLVGFVVLALSIGPFSFEIKSGLPRVALRVEKTYAADTVIVIASTASTTWQVPSDWNNTANTIEIIGGGGGGRTGAGSGGSSHQGGGGGGGGAYAKITGFSTSTGNSIRIQVGGGGAADTAGKLTYFNWNGSGSTSTCSGTTMSACANAGGTGATSPNAGAGGASSTSVGTVRNAGGAGGAGQAVKNTNGGGGGGAAGLNGNGNVGQPSTGTSAGGSGDAGSGGTGGSAGTPPTSNGGDGTEWTTAGSGGGGGGASSNNTAGGAGGAYGAGGGGGRSSGGAGGAGNQGIIVITYTPTVTPVTTLGNGTSTNPGNVTIAPEASATSSDAFTFLTNTATDIVTAVVVGLTPNTTSGISKVEITNETSSVVYGSSTDPTANSFSITLNQNTLTATTATTTYKIRLTPKTHANMPAPPGAEYAVTSTILSFTSSNASSGTDGTSGTVTIDNLSPNEVSATSTTPGSGQIDLSWSNPGDSDFSNLLIVRATSSAVTGTPTEGSSSSVGTAFGNGFIIYTGNGTSVSDTGLSDGTTYHYKIWAKDTNGNFSTSTNGVTANATTNAAPSPQIRSAANQTFTISSSSIAISPITVTSTAASQITAASDIRIVISTGTTNYLWDTTDLTLATTSGNGDISGIVSYENSSSTLVINVLTDFSNASSVTVTGLSYRDFNSVNSATTSLDFKWQGAAQTDPVRATSTTVTIRGRLALAEHSSGQESDKFVVSSTSANQEMFAFELAPRDEAASTTLVIDLSGITGSGIATGDLTNPKIFVDTNANGALDGGETTQHFGNGTVNISGETGMITFNATTSTVPSATSTRYILVATTTNLIAGDTITFSLGTSTVAADGQTSKVRLDPNSSSSVSNAVHTVNAASRNQRSFRWQNDDGATVNANTAMAASDTAVSNIKIGQRLTLRMQADNDGGGDGGIAYKLQYQANGTSSTWSDVSTSNEIRPSDGLAGANGASITSAVAATNARTFANGVWTEGTAVSNSQTLPNNSYTELGFMIDTGNATTTTSTTYFFRVVNNDGGGNPLDGITIYPSLTTVTPASNTIQYSKQAGSLPSTTSSVQYFFDDADYSGVTSDDTSSSTISATATNFPLFNFRVKNATSVHPMKIAWKGRQTNATTTLIDVYRFGSTNAWQTVGSLATSTVGSDFSFSGSFATSSSEYYQADGPNFWSYIRVRQEAASTTVSLTTNQISVEYEPAADSAADQTFTVSDAETAISQLTIKASPDTPVVTAANDIRIVIPDTLNMKWATTTTVATLGGSASGKASTTVSYPNDKTLLINVTSSFAVSDNLTVSGLSFTNFSSASASTTLNAFYGGSTSTSPDYVDAKIKQIRGQYVLGAHAAGQMANKFDSGGNSTTSELLVFQVVPTGENATSTQIVVDISDIQGIVTADVTSTQLFLDLNNNGYVDASDPQVGSTGTVSISGSAGMITFAGSFAVTSTRDMILRATVNDIQPGDGFNLSVAPSGLTANGHTSKIALAASGAGQNARHNKPSNRGGGGGAFGTPPWVANQGGGTPGSGTGEEGGSGGGPPPNQGGGGPGGGGGEAP